MQSSRKTGTVYSTEAGRICPECGRASPECICRGTQGVQADGTGLRVRRETKGRKGKCVTVVENVPLPDAALRSLGKELKAACGSGGTVKAGRIEIQGDHGARVLEELRTRGWTAKRSGG